MTPRTFFTLFIKILSLWVLLDSISAIPGLIASLSVFSSKEDTLAEIIIALSSYALIFFLYYVILRYGVYRTDWLIDKLSLDKHFADEKIGLDIDRFTIVQIAIIVMGGVFFVSALPSFVQQLYNYLARQHFAELAAIDKKPGWLAYYFLKLSISYILMTKSRWVTGLIEREVATGELPKTEGE